MEPATQGVEVLRDLARAATLLDPLRLAILDQASTPRSAAEIAGELDLPRQRVNYHVKELARAGLLEPAGRAVKGNFTAQRYRASADGYVVGSDVLGPMAADPTTIDDRMSVAYLLALSARLQREVGAAAEQASAGGWRPATLALDAELRFESAGQRRAFAEALRDAVAGVIAEHASPVVADGGGPGEGTPYRLMLGCWPVLAEPDTADAEEGPDPGHDHDTKTEGDRR